MVILLHISVKKWENNEMVADFLKLEKDCRVPDKEDVTEVSITRKWLNTISLGRPL